MPDGSFFSPGLIQCLDLLPRSQTPPKVDAAGVLHADAVLSWTGTRPYRLPNGETILALRREEQVFAPSHLATTHKLTATRGHPFVDRDGNRIPVLLDMKGRGEVDEDGFVRLPPISFIVGALGESTGRVEIDGAPMPVGRVSIYDPDTITAITKEGLTQTSLGYRALKIPVPGGYAEVNGKRVRADIEHILDLDDPRTSVKSLMAMEYPDGEKPFPTRESAEELRRLLGANHYAVAIPNGRAGPGAEVLLDRANNSQLWFSTNPTIDDLYHAGAVDTTANHATISTTDSAPRILAMSITVQLSSRKVSLRHSTIDEMTPASAKILRDIIEQMDETLEEQERDTANMRAKRDELAGMLEGAQGEAAAAGERATAAEATAEEANADRDRMKAEMDALNAELAPFRAAAAKTFRDEAHKLAPSLDRASLDSLDSNLAVKRAVVGAHPAYTADGASDGYIEAAYDFIGATPSKVETVAPVAKPSRGFVRAVNSPTSDAAPSRGEALRAQLKAAYNS